MKKYFQRAPTPLEKAQFHLAKSQPYLALSVFAFYRLAQIAPEIWENKDEFLKAVERNLNGNSILSVQNFLDAHGNNQLLDLTPDLFFKPVPDVSGLASFTGPFQPLSSQPRPISL